MAQSSWTVRLLGHGTVAVACSFLSISTCLGKPQARTLDIAGGRATETIAQFAVQTGMQVLFEPDSIADRTTRGVKGTYDAGDALEMMLVNSGLRFEVVNRKTIAILPSRMSFVALLASERSGKSSEDITVQGGQSFRRADLGGASARTENESSGVDQSDSSKGIAQVIVTGTHIRGSSDGTTQLIVLDDDYIQKSGYSTIQDVLKTLPQAAAGPSEDNVQGGDPRIIGNVGRGSGVNLRGLGAGATLILINGVRQVSSGTGGSFVDVSTIPTTAIDRIEILPDGASAVYGSDAIGGVVNIILKDKYRGFETVARLGTLDGDANELKLSQLVGTGWSAGHVFLGYEYYKRESLAAADRSYSGDSDQRRNGGDNFSSFNSNPGNIICRGAQFGCLPGRPAFAIPAGQDGTSLTVSDLIPVSNDAANANLMNTLGTLDLLAEQEMHSAFFELTQEVGSLWELTASGRFSIRPFDAYLAATGQQLVVRPTNPYFIDPFGGQSLIVLGYSLSDDFNMRSEGDTTTYSGTVGASAKLGHDWQARLIGSFSLQELKATQTGFNQTVLQEALGNFPGIDNPETPSYNPTTHGFFNPFGDGSNTPPEALAAMQLLRVAGRSTSEAMGSTLIADGPAITLPGGATKFAIGADFRREQTDTGTETGQLEDTLSRDVWAGFAEISAPIFSDRNARRGFRRLNVTMAARLEQYQDFGSTFNPKLGFRWEPGSLFSVRGTWGTSYKAPFLVDRDPTQFNRNVVYDASLQDDQSQTGFATVLVMNGTNPALREERAESWTIGVDLKPERFRNLMTSLTYYSTKYRDRIATGGTPGRVDFILLEDDIWETLVKRNPSAEDVAVACATALEPFTGCESFPADAIVDLRLQNIALQEVHGIDVQFQQELNTVHGNWRLGLNANYSFSNKRQFSSTSRSVDVLDTFANPLSFKIRGILSWEHRSLSANAVVNHTPAYKDPLVGGNGVARDISSWTTTDLGIAYQAPEGGILGGTRFSGHVVNLFDEDPPYANAAVGYDSVNADPYGRMLTVQLSKAW